MSLRRFIVSASCLFAIALCVACVPTQQISNDPTHVPTRPPKAYSDANWEKVLDKFVEGGLVDYKRLAADRIALDRFLGQISLVGPESTPKLFPTPSDRMCYYINAYNACAIRAVLQSYPTRTAYRLNNPSFEHGLIFKIDRRQVTLGRLRERLESVSRGDIRVLFCLCSAALGSPPLSEEIYRPDTLREQMRQAIQRMIEDPKLLRVSHEDRQVFLWMRMIRQRGEFIKHYRKSSGLSSNSLLDFLLQYGSAASRQDLGRAQDYAEKIMPFDRRLNDRALGRN